MTVRVARPAARLLIVDAERRVLMFHFTPPNGADFWATPGGACDPGETYAQAARRELIEETGIDADPGPEVAQKTAEFTTIEGQDVSADERYFLVRVADRTISADGYTELERRVMTGHHWWTLDELRETRQTVFPEDLADLVEASLNAAEDAKTR
ncbi:NUDIX hydrolase [Sphingomonas sp. SUN039]|uniref:NUDIX hydrolase n=1 Tax=Sphingomonas sp. SUN039 TaxID=2937787 RepID=UPI0021649929|nr:NUDIX domain-containing protein [Sphingomonas sp. SUN039]UVO54837.1 NUDIX domain-containing protein [Sphingomonas sp. SUN039]